MLVVPEPPERYVTVIAVDGIVMVLPVTVVTAGVTTSGVRLPIVLPPRETP